MANYLQLQPTAGAPQNGDSLLNQRSRAGKKIVARL